MKLERDTSRYPLYGYHSQTADNFRSFPGDQEICVRFSKFGGQHSEFAVYLNWQDIERSIRAFAEMDHPDALQLQRASNLARAVVELVGATSPGLCSVSCFETAATRPPQHEDILGLNETPSP